MKGTCWALEALASRGYRYDSSIFPVLHPDYGWKEFPRDIVRVATEKGEIIEFPPFTWRFLGKNVPFGGGGYFRLFPLWLVSMALSSSEKRGIPCCIYLHPWELDPAQPKAPVRGIKRFRHYVNLRGTRKKLERLLERHEFTTMNDVIQRLNMLNIKRIPLA